MLHKGRIGKISSSEFYRIHESKAVQETYIEELRMFNIFKHNDPEKDVFNFIWGHLCESYLHEKTDIFKGYVNQNNEENATIFSKRNILHCGTPDQYSLIGENLISSETKSPTTLNGLWKIIFPFYQNGTFQEIDGNEAIELIRKNSKEGRKYFDQIISNGILLEEELGLECTHGELVAFMPYSEEIENIVKYAEDFLETEYYPIQFGTSTTLPCIKPLQKDNVDFFDLDECYPVLNCHKIRFNISDDLKETYRKDIDNFSKRIFSQLETS